ncbi:DNA polymerase III subunit beta [Candidatus Saccharibacteria bacterium]|nr:DNA polymerase III subunit beta [Candidatus Saccharibacteria bacterium]
MKLQITQNKLSKALSIASRIATPKAGLPILNNILLRTDKSSLTISSTNLEVAIIESIPAEISKPGSITIPAKLLAEFINNLPNKPITLEVIKGNLKITSDQYKSTINGIDSDDFPELPILDEEKVVSFIIPTDEFKEAITQTIVTGSNDTTRPALIGVYFNTFENDLFIAATDGYRLAERKFIENVADDIALIVPISSLQEVLRSLSEEITEIKILFDENQVKFQLNSIEITSKIIDSNFPNYRQLIPKTTDVNIILNTSEFLRVTKLSSLFARESGGSIIIETNSKDNNLIISSVASEVGENNSTISVDVDTDSKITLSSRFLIDALNHVSDSEIKFGFSGKLAPVVVKNSKIDNYTHIIMPLKS